MDEASEEKRGGFRARNTRTLTVLLLIAIFVFGTIQAVSDRSGSVTAEVGSNMLGVLGSYGETVFVQREEITQVRLADELDFGRMLEGEETKTTLSGRYENDVFGAYTLHVYPEKAPYIVVSYGDGETLVFKQKTAKQTRALYEELTEKI